MFGRKKKKVICPVNVLYDTLEDDLKEGLCTEIDFIYNGKKHVIGSYGDHGETTETCVFYLDKQEFDDKAEFYASAVIDDVVFKTLCDTDAVVEIKNWDGGVPATAPPLAQYIVEE